MVQKFWLGMLEMLCVHCHSWSLKVQWGIVFKMSCLGLAEAFLRIPHSLPINSFSQNRFDWGYTGLIEFALVWLNLQGSPLEITHTKKCACWGLQIVLDVNIKLAVLNYYFCFIDACQIFAVMILNISCSLHVFHVHLMLLSFLFVSFDIFIKRPKLTLSLADEASAQAPATLPVEGIKITFQLVGGSSFVLWFNRPSSHTLDLL